MTNETSLPAEDGTFLVAALYHFVSVPRFADLREPLQALCEDNGVRGTLLLAHEGINGTIAGPHAGIRTVLGYLPGWSTRRALPPTCPSCA
jgi:UPF0176 protein